MEDTKKTAAPAPTVYEVFGLAKTKEGTMPVKFKGVDLDLVTATQADLKVLFEAKQPFVRIKE